MREFEKRYWEKGKLVAGLDEAGRGPLAGPVAVGVVVFPPFIENFLKGDSKQYSAKEREIIFYKIIRKALFVGVSFATPREIEKLNIYRATQKAYYRAFKQIPFKVSAVITDYMPLPELEGVEVFSPPKADRDYLSVAAASIVAKVVRDKLMELYGKVYPQYGFEKHKGYPTREHKEALKKFGACEIHRRNFKSVFINLKG